MRNIAVFAGSSHPALAARIAAYLGVPLGDCRLGKFSNGETQVQMLQSVRETDVYIVQSGCGKVNDALIELLIMISACKMASAAKVTAVLPCFPYARQPDEPYHRNPRSFGSGSNGGVASTAVAAAVAQSTAAPARANSLHEPGLHPALRSASSASLDEMLDAIQAAGGAAAAATESKCADLRPGYRQWQARSGTLVANMLTTAGADHIITLDLHDPQFQGYFDIPVDNLYSEPLMIKYIKEHIPGWEAAVIVSPDAGGAKRATQIADRLGLEFALVHKGSRKPAACAQRAASELMLVGDVRGRVAILIDDIADTSHTVTRAAALLRENGATRVHALVTHAVLSGDAVQRIRDSGIDELAVSNSIPQDAHVELLGAARCKVFDIAPILAEAVRRIHNGESVSVLFDSALLI